MKKKNLLAIVLGLSLAIAAAVGCGTEEGQGNGDSFTKSEDYSNVSFRIAWWGSETRNEETIELIREFEKRYPGLKVEVEYCRSTDYRSKLNTQAAGNDLPDVFQLTYSDLNIYASKGQLMELDHLVEKGAINLEGVSDILLAGGKMDGRIYAVPTGTNAPCYIYNPALLEEAGVTLSKSPTLTEFVEVCKTVYEKTGAKAHNPISDQLFRSMGGDTYAREGNALGYTAEMRALFWLDKLAGMEQGYYLSPNDYMSLDDGNNLASELIWCYGGFTNELEALEQWSGLDLELCCYPVMDDAVEPNASIVTPNMMWCIAPDTENVELAAAFIDFFTNNTVTYDICGTDRGVPISAAMREYVNRDASSAVRKVNEFMDYLVDGHSMELNMNIPIVSTRIAELVTELDAYVRYQEITAEEVPALAEECVRRANEILSELD